MITDSWDIKTLADLVDDTIGGLWGNSPESDKQGEEDVIVIRGADFKNWSTRGAADAAPRRVPSRAIPQRRLAPGDLVLEVSGGGPAQPVGRVLIIDERVVAQAGKPLITSNFCRKLRLKPGVDPYFVKSQLDWLYSSGHTDNFQTSTTNIRNLQVEDFLNGTEITLPSLMEQGQIVSVINEAGKKREDSLNHLQRSKNVIERFQQVVLAAACSGRLTSDWRDKHATADSASALIERSMQLLAAHSHHQLRYNETLDPDWLVLPNSWQWASLANLAAIRGGIQKQPKRTPKRNAYPYLRVANVHRGQLDLSEIHQFELQDGELEIYRLEPGDLLVVEGNGSASEIGRCALWNGEIADCVHQNHIIRVRCVEMEPRFVELYWNSPLGSREIASLAVTSAGLYSLSTKKIGSVLVPVAPLEEQREVVRRVHTLLNIADRLQDRIEVAIRRVERSSQAILAKAFRGELSATANEKQNAELGLPVYYGKAWTIPSSRLP